MSQAATKLLVPVLLTIATVSCSTPNPDGVVLITGANRGIGLTLAETFSNAGYSVIGTVRRLDSAAALKKLPVRVMQLDVTDPASVASLAAQIGTEQIDILINNAGVMNDEPRQFADVDIERLVSEYQVNALGPLRVTQALLPNIMSGKQKIVANISSKMGSMELNSSVVGCCLGYRASKAALNIFTKTLALDMADQGVIFVALAPGFVRTDMNEGKGRFSPAQSAARLFAVISGLGKADNGKFINHDGKPMPW